MNFPGSSLQDPSGVNSSSPLLQSATQSSATSPSSSFFFYDPLFGDELTLAEDYLLYFYPEDVPLDNQINLQGAAAAMVAFASQFTNEPINVVSLKYIKMAIKCLPNQIIMVYYCFCLFLETHHALDTRNICSISGVDKQCDE